MRPGPAETTRRGRKAGGRELRAWASAEEFALVDAAAVRQGVTRDAFIRGACLDAATPTPKGTP